MKSDGTILKRIFDPFQSERDRLDFFLEKVRSVCSTSGRDQKKSSVYTKLDGIKSDYTRKLARWIVNIAREYSVYGIVFEYLDKMKSKWKHKIKIHHWNKKKIQDLTKNIAFRYGIRTFFINPKNTSALAFDGSGPVTRNSKNFSLCTFTTGKQYNADLNASYNIGARYFLRELERSSSKKKYNKLLAEVPELNKRTDCTYETLIKVSHLVQEKQKLVHVK